MNCILCNTNTCYVGKQTFLSIMVVHDVLSGFNRCSCICLVPHKTFCLSYLRWVSLAEGASMKSSKSWSSDYIISSWKCAAVGVFFVHPKILTSLLTTVKETPQWTIICSRSGTTWIGAFPYCGNLFKPTPAIVDLSPTPKGFAYVSFSSRRRHQALMHDGVKAAQKSPCVVLCIWGINDNKARFIKGHKDNLHNV